MKRNAMGCVALTALCITLGTGDAVTATAPSRPTAAVERADRDARILVWILERNPAADVEEFMAFPAVLLAESARAGIDYRLILRSPCFNSFHQRPPSWPSASTTRATNHPGSSRTKRGRTRYSSLGSLADPKVNVRYGIEYLKWQIERFGMTPDGLRAYNRHPDRAREVWPQDRYAEDVALRYLTLVHRLE